MIYVEIFEDNRVSLITDDASNDPRTRGIPKSELEKRGYFTKRFPFTPKLEEGEKAYLYYYPKEDRFDYKLVKKGK